MGWLTVCGQIGLMREIMRVAMFIIKEMLENKITQLNDFLVKVAAWTHIMSVNKLGYISLQLLTSKFCNIPRLTMGNKVTESVLDTDAVQKIIERLLRT